MSSCTFISLVNTATQPRNKVTRYFFKRIIVSCAPQLADLVRPNQLRNSIHSIHTIQYIQESVTHLHRIEIARSSQLSPTLKVNKHITGKLVFTNRHFYSYIYTNSVVSVYSFYYISS